MTIESLLIFLLIGAIAGWLAGVIVKGFGFGLVGNIVVGIVGAFIAGLIFIQTTRCSLLSTPPERGLFQIPNDMAPITRYAARLFLRGPRP